VVTLGTIPRTHPFYFTNDKPGVLLLNQYGNFINTSYAANLIVQREAWPSDPNDELDWLATCRTYFKLMSALRAILGFKVGIVGFNGGTVTRKELMMASQDYKWPVCLIKGSGRVTDELIATDMAKLENVTVASFKKPQELRDWMIRYQFLPAPVQTDQPEPGTVPMAS